MSTVISQWSTVTPKWSIETPEWSTVKTMEHYDTRVQHCDITMEHWVTGVEHCDTTVSTEKIQKSTVRPQWSILSPMWIM